MADQHEILLELLRDVNHGMGKCMKEVLIRHDVPFTVLIVMKHIAQEPGITISQLSRRASIAKSHVSNNIRELSQKGWVEKRGDAADQRLMRLYLTKPAMDNLLLIKIEIKEEFASLIAGIPEELAPGLIDGLLYIKLALENKN